MIGVAAWMLLYVMAIVASVLFVGAMILRLVRAQERKAAALEELARKFGN